MFWILVAIGILGLVFACWAVVHSIFDSANQVLEMIDSPPTAAAFPRGNRNDEV
jgi:hypothetical protein